MGIWYCVQDKYIMLDTGRKLCILPSNQPLFNAPPLESCNTGRAKKTKMMGLPGREKSLMISLAVSIKHTNVTDVQISADVVRRLRTASRGIRA